MTSADLTAEQIIQITDYVDVEAPPPDGQPSALLTLGTNQLTPAQTASPEARESQKTLIDQGADDQAVRVEDQSANTRQNAELALPYPRQATSARPPVTAICK